MMAQSGEQSQGAITGREQSQQATGTIASLAKPIIRSRGLFEHATTVN
jgi:hypothetical protein